MKQEYIGQKIIHLSRKIDRVLGKNFSQYGLSIIQGRIISFVYRESPKGDIFQKDIEERFKIRGSSVTSVLNLMESRGILKRISAEEDGRCKKILLMDKGNELYDAVHKELIDMENLLSSGLTKEEESILMELLDKLAKTVDDSFS
ncbi:MarR family winged helix-turn-helix transcriptional regulator [Anaerocolumna aminovalerica]|uniref:MarR family winged helix-turn-helix transcriptional regulator n=1 Tax=Anaerocolumna aminovalerica TaxID=1527 RepID=UPI000BE3C964|nr:MarR family winged helix-turn-helix transcriptional regulator [Anaerocolumna aminovalerica]